MIKNLSLLFISLLLLQAVTAQENDIPDVRFGLRAGASFSHLDFSKGVPPTPTKTSWGAGINFGFVMEVPLIPRLSFQPEYLFSQMGGKVKNSDTTYKLNYLSFPLFLKFQMTEKFSLMAGPQFDILINAKRKANGSSVNITHDTEERSIFATAGIEYEIIESFSVCARYMYGFNHVGLGQRSDLQEFKYTALQLTAYVKF
jgi:Outer membrane protein beta-barrel domain